MSTRGTVIGSFFGAATLNFVDTGAAPSEYYTGA
jgi:hypothetical protein